MEDTYRSQFRLPYALYELLKAAADANKRSVNAELVSRLEQSFSPSPSFDFDMAQYATLKADIIKDLVAELENQGKISKP